MQACICTRAPVNICVSTLHKTIIMQEHPILGIVAKLKCVHKLGAHSNLVTGKNPKAMGNSRGKHK